MFCLIFAADWNKLFSGGEESEKKKSLYSQPYMQIRNFRRKTCRGWIQVTAIATSRPHLKSDIKVVPWLRPTFQRGGPNINQKKILRWNCFGRSDAGTRFFQSTSVSSVIIIPTMVHVHFLNYHRHYIIWTTESVVKQGNRTSNTLQNGGWNISVGIATLYWLNGLWIKSRYEASFSVPSRLVPIHKQPSM